MSLQFESQVLFVGVCSLAIYYSISVIMRLILAEQWPQIRNNTGALKWGWIKKIETLLYHNQTKICIKICITIK